MIGKYQLRRGSSSYRETITLDVGEPFWDKSLNQLFIGDGTTPGGVVVKNGTEADIQANTAARHTHTNTLILNAITQAGSGSIITSAERSKLSDINQTLSTTSSPTFSGQVLVQGPGDEYFKVGSTTGNNAGILFDAQDGDFVGIDYCSITQESADKSMKLNNRAGDIVFESSTNLVKPKYTNAIDLGNASYQWKNINAKSMTLNDSIFLYDSDSSTSGIRMQRGAGTSYWMAHFDTSKFGIGHDGSSASSTSSDYPFIFNMLSGIFEANNVVINKSTGNPALQLQSLNNTKFQMYYDVANTQLFAQNTTATNYLSLLDSGKIIFEAKNSQNIELTGTLIDLHGPLATLTIFLPWQLEKGQGRL